MAKKKKEDVEEVKEVASILSPIEALQAEVDATDEVIKKAKVKAGIPDIVSGLYSELEASGTGKNKLDFLLSLDFGKEKNKKTVAESAALAFKAKGYSLSTIKKILNYAKKAGSK